MYFRDFTGREVDFVVVEDEEPLIFIEGEWQDSPISKDPKYLKKNFPQANFIRYPPKVPETTFRLKISGFVLHISGLKIWFERRFPADEIFTMFLESF